MLKNKYQRMNKQEKRKIKEEYINTSTGKININRLRRVLIISIVCILYSIYLAIDTYLNSNSIILYIYSGLILLIAIIFFISYFKIKGKLLNKFAIEKSKKSN